MPLCGTVPCRSLTFVARAEALLRLISYFILNARQAPRGQGPALALPASRSFLKSVKRRLRTLDPREQDRRASFRAGPSLCNTTLCGGFLRIFPVIPGLFPGYSRVVEGGKEAKRGLPGSKSGEKRLKEAFRAPKSEEKRLKEAILASQREEERLKEAILASQTRVYASPTHPGYIHPSHHPGYTTTLGTPWVYHTLRYTAGMVRHRAPCSAHGALGSNLGFTAGERPLRVLMSERCGG